MLWLLLHELDCNVLLAFMLLEDGQVIRKLPQGGEGESMRAWSRWIVSSRGYGILLARFWPPWVVVTRAVPAFMAVRLRQGHEERGIRRGRVMTRSRGSSSSQPPLVHTVLRDINASSSSARDKQKYTFSCASSVVVCGTSSDLVA